MSKPALKVVDEPLDYADGLKWCPVCCDREVKVNLPGLVVDGPDITYNGERLPLSAMERAVVEILAIKYPKCATTDVCILWMYQERDEPGDADNCLKVYVTKLRKLEPFGLYIHTDWGIGYRFSTEPLGDTLGGKADKRRTVPLDDKRRKAEPAAEPPKLVEPEVVPHISFKTPKPIPKPEVTPHLVLSPKAAPPEPEPESKKPALRVWTLMDTIRIFFLVEKGCSWEEIGEELERSPLACLNRYRKLRNKKISPDEFWRWGSPE